jgi:hypothetical protein
MVLAETVEDLLSHTGRATSTRSGDGYFPRARDADRRLVRGDKPDELGRRAVEGSPRSKGRLGRHPESHESQDDHPFLFLLIDGMGD